MGPCAVSFSTTTYRGAQPPNKDTFYYFVICQYKIEFRFKNVINFYLLKIGLRYLVAGLLLMVNDRVAGPCASAHARAKASVATSSVLGHPAG